MKFRVGACALLVCLAGCSGKGPNTDFAELRGAAATKSAVAQLPKPQLGRTAAKSIANAPDRGALVSYKNKGAPTKREGAYTFYPVAISEDHALKALVTGDMSMPMPDGTQVKIKYERHDESPDGNWTWIGRVVGGDPQQEAIITFGEKAVFASIPQANGAPPLSIQTRNGALFAVQTDPSKVKSPNKGHNDMLVPAALAVREAAAAQVQANAQVSQNAIAQNAPATAANTVDVAIGYTAGYRATYGSQSAATTRLTFLIQVGNQAYSNSVINGYLRLVSATEVAYTDGNSNQTALHDLTGSNGTSNVAIPASLTPLRTARDQYGADIAILVRDFQQPEHQGCGIAWLIGANQREILPSDAPWAYAVVSDGDDTGSDNQSYYCAPETLVHEASHLMGSAHDVSNSPNSTGRYPYSYGYKTANGNFYTVMAYGDEGQTPYRVFSNPNIATCGGNACGVANQADNARSLNQTIPVVAKFRAAAIPFDPVAYTGLIDAKRPDFNGDGRVDMTWTLNTAGEWAYWAMSGATKIGGAGYPVGVEWKILAMGDFRGDGRTDVIWTNGGEMQLWDGTGSAFTGAAMRNYPADYTLVAVGDVNGDGRDDLVWREDAKTNIGVWLMNGPNVIGSASYAAGPAWNILGTGDLNGDSRLDLIWSDGSLMQLWQGTATGFTGYALPSFPAGWTLFGVGDMDGDNRDDLFWRYSNTGEVAYWRMTGATRISGMGFPASASWSPLQVADFNNDGRVDIVWTNNVEMQLWQSNGVSFVGVPMPGFPSGWTFTRR